MAQIEYIKHLREKEVCSIKEIADKLEINWRTARKFADRLDWNKNQLPRRKHYPVMAPFIEIVDAWLTEDQAMPRKQRHTAKRIYDRLVQEHGYTGSDRTVRDYVSKRRKELKLQEMGSYIKLEHPGGEAQVDFGKVKAVVKGKEQELHLLVVSFPYSNAAFPIILPSENTECFLEGLKRVFERIGGVPRTLWFDNLSAAVVSIQSNGQRVVTDAFQRFMLHYRFESTFCNPGKGNEKGHVENKVGYSRRNWCVPMPFVSSLEELQQTLDQQAEQDLHRPHYEKGTWMNQLWAEE
ncbi:IS21 family transposase [Brevibacillus parabrevis]|uniref:IS21 family transposase n=1 Tax=Brevibacillus parabrevis TaxID=54914 RepID=UPI002E1C4C20|nr:IS21 family transposase [Brevibacillus parabrevis]MED1721163.1 IS21 family transposase [Brevibacillus parabrevis]